MIPSYCGRGQFDNKQGRLGKLAKREMSYLCINVCWTHLERWQLRSHVIISSALGRVRSRSPSSPRDAAGWKEDKHMSKRVRRSIAGSNDSGCSDRLVAVYWIVGWVKIEMSSRRAPRRRAGALNIDRPSLRSVAEVIGRNGLSACQPSEFHQ
jgi:hypothetical protein